MKKRILAMTLAAAVTVGMMSASLVSAADLSADNLDYSADEGEIYMFVSSPEYADAIAELIDAYKEVAPNVTINYETTQNDYPTLLKAKINSGEVPDIFASAGGMEIDLYKEYSENIAGTSIDDALTEGARKIASDSEGNVYGTCIKDTYLGMLYNEDIFTEVGIEVPATIDELEAACQAIEEAGYQAFSTGYAEWWIFKQSAEFFLSAAAENAGLSCSELVESIKSGETHISDYPELYDNYFKFVDLTVEYGDDKPLEVDLAGQLAALATGEAAMILGQGDWDTADLYAINPDLNVGITGYPVSSDAAQAQIATNPNPVITVYNESPVKEQALHFLNWWVNSEYGKSWFTDVANVAAPIQGAKESENIIVVKGLESAAEKGVANAAAAYSTDSFHQAFGELMQAYVAGTADKDTTCAAIEEQWAVIDGQ